jgi:hypothetical protein
MMIVLGNCHIIFHKIPPWSLVAKILRRETYLMTTRQMEDTCRLAIENMGSLAISFPLQ